MWSQVTRYGITSLACLSTLVMTVALILFLKNRHLHPLNKMNAGLTTLYALTVIVHAALWALPFGVTQGNYPCAIFLLSVPLAMSNGVVGFFFVLSILVRLFNFPPVAGLISSLLFF